MSQKLTRVYNYALEDSTCTFASASLIESQEVIVLGDINGSGEVHFSAEQKKRNKFSTLQNSEIQSVELTRESKSFLVGNARGSIFLFDIINQKQVEVFTRHSAAVLTLQAIGKNTFISGSLDTTVRMWDDRQKTEAVNFKGHTGAIFSVSISPDDQWVASASEDGTVRIWDVTMNKALHTFIGPEQKSLCCLAFNPEEIQVAAGGISRKPLLYDLEKFTENGNASLVPSTIMSMAFDPSGSFLYAAGAGFLRSINAKQASEWQTIDANWKIPQKIFFSEQGELFGLGRNPNGASLYKLANVKSNQKCISLELHETLAELNDINSARKSHFKIAEILEKKTSDITTLINVWLHQQNQRAAQDIIDKISDPKVVTDIFNMMLRNNMIENLSVEFATLFLKKIYLILEVKYKFFIKLGLEFGTEVLKKFGPEIRSSKRFNPISKIDLNREERMRAYDVLLIELQSITTNSIFVKLRVQYKSEEIGQLANNYAAELENLLL